MEESARRNLSGIFVALAATLGGVAIVLALQPLVDDNAPTLLLVLVLLATSWYGAWPTFTATLLCLTADAWFFLEPQHSFRIQSSGDFIRLAAFALIGVVLGLFGEKRLRHLYDAERRQRFLANLAAATQRLSDPEQVTAVTARMLAEHLGADRCAYAEVEDENIFIVTGEHSRDLTSIKGRWPVGDFGAECRRLMLANKPFVVTDADADSRSAEALPAFHAIRARAVICVPLHKHERLTAAMAVHQSSPRSWSEAEVDLVQTVVGRCWEALERASTARRLRESEARKAAMIGSALDAIVTIDHEGRIVEFNPAAEDMFGWRQEDALGQELAELVIPPEMRQRHRDGLARRLRTGEGRFLNRHLELTALRRDGSGFPIELSITLIDTVDPPLFTGFIRDITKRKQSEQALRQSEELFRTLAENISQFAWMADPGGQAFWYNQRWLDYTGATLEVMRERGGLSFVHPEHAPRVLEGYQHCMKSGEPWEDTFPLLGRSGEYRWFLSRALPIRGADGVIERWFGTNTDITSERVLQEELSRSAERLAEADRRKDEFLATLAHELRNPLAPIRTGLTLVRMAEGDPAVLASVRDTLERQTDQLITLVDDLLDVSRITRGKLELRIGSARLSSIVRSAEEAARPLMDEAGHRLEIDLGEQDPELRCDPHRIAQVLSNLLNNAARYTPQGGLITLEAHVAADEVAITVRDNGIGIPRARLDEIFEMFTQIASPLDGARGLGVGLTLARSLVEMHGGSIEVLSEGENLGSEFTVRLPLPGKKDSPSPVQGEDTDAPERNPASAATRP